MNDSNFIQYVLNDSDQHVAAQIRVCKLERGTGLTQLGIHAWNMTESSLCM